MTDALPPDTSPETLMARAQAGDRQAYAMLLRMLTQSFSAYLGNKVPREEIDDIVQEILLSLHKARHTWDPSRPFMPWAMAIARYRLQDHWRRHYRRRAGAHEDIATYADRLPEPDGAENLHRRDELHKARAVLSEQQRAILALMYEANQPVQDVAAQLRMSVSAVKVAAHRAYKKMRQHLERS